MSYYAETPLSCSASIVRTLSSSLLAVVASVLGVFCGGGNSESGAAKVLTADVIVLLPAGALLSVSCAIGTDDELAGRVVQIGGLAALCTCLCACADVSDASG
eukprot:CAMPEP_0179423044 /NCGR_PEP_ID=MMETSP0799-20121207/10781_1 /TAXON_ID=46947 /ORGANISM="Geminigera cryophila, Strain CCMP2564" /LENGTH=102 /DNA_ID=CAMNT_0021197275 /DNA_START=54 /DNA_END=362 /DNA_ORIENTATION=-